MIKPTISILGAGWLGEPLGAHLVKQGYMVKAATTRADKIGRLNDQGMKAYLLKVNAQITGKQVHDFFHCDVLFINIPPGRKHPDVEQRFPRQIRLILAAAEQVGKPNYLFISSTSVYGNGTGITNEMTTPKPPTNSGKALLSVEQYLQEQLNERLTILRFSGLAGGTRRPGRWFAGKQNLSGGNMPVNMVHREDCIAIITAILKQEQWGQIFNVCADQHPIKRIFYPHQAKKDNLKPPTYVAEDEGNGKIVSNEKVKKFLNYQFRFPDPMNF